MENQLITNLAIYNFAIVLFFPITIIEMGFKDACIFSVAISLWISAVVTLGYFVFVVIGV